ncbi:hypothetical protein HAX54_036085 [Datura stramonium]|uniref:Uncharacterized protein n=1 Tax=Datura stramonium TaxID=4076 RepID=A0ABS8VHI2_DATST|nr:hypothetical protein [Datura stramonium]
MVMRPKKRRGVGTVAQGSTAQTEQLLLQLVPNLPSLLFTVIGDVEIRGEGKTNNSLENYGRLIANGNDTIAGHATIQNLLNSSTGRHGSLSLWALAIKCEPLVPTMQSISVTMRLMRQCGLFAQRGLNKGKSTVDNGHLALFIYHGPRYNVNIAKFD